MGAQSYYKARMLNLVSLCLRKEEPIFIVFTIFM